MLSAVGPPATDASPSSTSTVRMSRPSLRSLPSGPPLIVLPDSDIEAPEHISGEARVDPSRIIQDHLLQQLAAMASALASEVKRREVEEKKVVGLRLAIEESRKVIGRFQNEKRRTSSNASLPSRSRRSSPSRVASPLVDHLGSALGGERDTKGGDGPMEREKVRRAHSDGLGSTDDTKRIARSGFSIKMPARTAVGFYSGSRSAGLFDTEYDFSAASEKRRESRDSSSTGKSPSCQVALRSISC